MINIICPSRYKINRKQIREELKKILIKKNIVIDSPLNIIFIGRNKMRQLAKKYKNEDLSLPVLSFNYNQENDQLLGEIFICYPEAVLLAVEQEKRVDYVINFLISHGLDNIIKNI